MVKALSFKGDPKTKKRKRTTEPSSSNTQPSQPALATSQPSAPSAEDETEDDTTWTLADTPTDISGPVLLVLPTQPATCLASDANGSIFASPVENMIEHQPWTAEPHDVRQVWIANRVAGTERVSFKGSGGRYFGADRWGGVRAEREAVGSEEGWGCVSVVEEQEGARVEVKNEDDGGLVKREDRDGNDDGDAQIAIQTAGLRSDMGASAFYLQTSRNTYLSATTLAKNSKVEVEIRADASSPGPATQIVVRMQSRFKPKLKAAKVDKAREKISRSQIEAEAGRRLDDDEVKKLKRARRDGTYHEALLDVKVKGKHDKYA